MVATPKKLITYETAKGKNPYEDWLDDLDPTVSLRIEMRVNRVVMGNFGDVKPVGDGVSELRIFLVLDTEFISPNKGTNLSFFSVVAIKARKPKILKPLKLIGRISRGGAVIKINGKTYAGADHKEWTIKKLRESEDYQREYLKAAIEENSDMPELILMALREIAEARGYEKFATDAGLNQKSLYRILDEDKEAKPRYETIYQLIHALGLRFTVEVDPEKERVG